MAKQAVLIKVMVQTVWAEVDTETGLALEHIDPPIPIPAGQWAEFYERWIEDWSSVRQRVAEIDKEKVSLNGA